MGAFLMSILKSPAFQQIAAAALMALVEVMTPGSNGSSRGGKGRR
jgi:hypothetical protein